MLATVVGGHGRLTASGLLTALGVGCVGAAMLLLAVGTSRRARAGEGPAGGPGRGSRRGSDPAARADWYRVVSLVLVGGGVALVVAAAAVR